MSATATTVEERQTIVPIGSTMPSKFQYIQGLSFEECYALARKSPYVIYETNLYLTKADSLKIIKEYNKANYRPFRKDNAEKHARMIEQGRFVWSPDGWIFDVEGELIQGQHRSGGHIQARTDGPIPAHVVFNVPHYVSGALDCGLGRSAADYVRREFDVKDANKLAPVLKRVHFGYGLTMSKLMPVEIIEVWPLYQEAIRKAVQSLPGTRRGITSGSTKGALARAYLQTNSFKLAIERNVENEVLLGEFAEKLISGDFAGDNRDDWISLCRGFVKDADCAGSTNQLAVYAKVQRALRGWLDMEPAKTSLKAFSEEMFPLPEEIAEKVRYIGRRAPTPEDIEEQENEE